MLVRIAAAVFEELHTPFSMADVEIDSPAAGEALVRIVATGVCHTDAITRDGDMRFPARRVDGAAADRRVAAAQPLLRAVLVRHVLDLPGVVARAGRRPRC